MHDPFESPSRSPDRPPSTGDTTVIGRDSRAEDLSRRLAQVTEVGLTLLPRDEMLQEILDRTRTVMGAPWGAVMLVDESTHELVPRASSGIETTGADRRIPVGLGVAGRVAERGRSELVGETRGRDRSDGFDQRMRSLALAPLVSGKAVVGVVVVGATEPDTFGETDLRLLEVVAERLAVGLERAALFDREHEQRIRAERALARTRALQQVAERLSLVRTEDEVHHALLTAAIDSTGAAGGAVALTEEGDLRIVAREGRLDLAHEPPPIERPMAEAVRSAVPIWGPSDAALRERYAMGPDATARNEAFVAVPMLSGTSVVGAIGLRFREIRAFDEEDLELVVAVARQAAIALDRARLQRAEDETSARARRLLESNVIGAMVEGPDDDILEANDAFLEIVGYTREDLEAGRLRWRAMTPPDQRHLSDAAMHKLLETGRAEPFEKEYIRRDGRRVPVLLGLALLQVEPFRAIGFVLDLSERHEAERERERLLELERRAREAAELARARAEAAITRLGLLTEAGLKLTGSLDVDEIASRLADVAVSGLADVAIVWRVRPEGGGVRTAVAHRVPHLRELLLEVAEAAPVLDDERNLVAQALASNRSIMVPTIGPSFAGSLVSGSQGQGALEGMGLRSALIVPLSNRGSASGVLVLGRSDDARPFDDADRSLAEQLAARAAQALENARLYAERAIVADTLQRSLLPPSLPDVPGVELSARYRPSGDGTQVGGDFYDVFSMANDDWGIALGDVCGKGAPAAAVMALSRYTIRTAALSETRPSGILKTLNESLLRHEDDRFCTAVFARLHPTPTGQRITVACGGHPLPLLSRADGSVSSLGKLGTLLGTFPNPSLTDAFADLEPGDAVIFYTDGLTEERRAGEAFGEERVVATLRGAKGRSADEIADDLLRAVLTFGPEHPRDDIAILVVRVEP
jgi:PAS domain S-box-containing protein